jgi:class I fructose-bisphosphate aldolase
MIGFILSYRAILRSIFAGIKWPIVIWGRARLINSGGASDDVDAAVVTAVINKRAGGTGLISGRKAFQRPVKEGIELLNAIQDVYLAREVTIA